ncbi:PREDICTED: uncharacterized protein LOC106818278 [Priapulus caudatus]|uniref:Uncharacterized protein LOC106818278 n=1 Tax=Priapulus caudatus TaxID=37621 RepID=A0ABM1F213_PRICU|nr:PREDICTED: uncharacterized protein LOC106818278 [Priapulus caudatus]
MWKDISFVPFWPPCLAKQMACKHEERQVVSIECSDHFTGNCFDHSGQTTRLAEDAVPILFGFPDHLKNDSVSESPATGHLDDASPVHRISSAKLCTPHETSHAEVSGSEIMIGGKKRAGKPARPAWSQRNDANSTSTVVEFLKTVTAPTRTSLEVFKPLAARKPRRYAEKSSAPNASGVAAKQRPQRWKTSSQSSSSCSSSIVMMSHRHDRHDRDRCDTGRRSRREAQSVVEEMGEKVARTVVGDAARAEKVEEEPGHLPWNSGRKEASGVAPIGEMPEECHAAAKQSW